MTEKINAVVLDITRHNDKLNVVNLYTRQRGRIGFLSPSGSGKSARLRQARLQPLAVIDADINFRPNSELQRLSSFSLREVWTDMYFNPVKRTLVFFLSEFLNNLLRASMPDENLWEYIVGTLSLLDRTDTLSPDFHIAFLSSLLPFMGIQPDNSNYKPGMAFDMRDGMFKDNPFNYRRPDLLTGEEADMAATLCRVNFSNVGALNLNARLRLQILRRLLDYYSIHFPGAGNLKSLEILHEVFS